MDYLNLLNELRYKRKYEKANLVGNKLLKLISNEGESANQKKVIYIPRCHVNIYKSVIKEMTIINFYTSDDRNFGQYYYDILWMVFGEKYTKDMNYYISDLIFSQEFSIFEKIKKNEKNIKNEAIYPHNPSILRYTDDCEYFIISVRLTNTYQSQGIFHTFPEDKIIKSEHAILFVKKNDDNTISLLKYFKAIEKELSIEHDESNQYRGIEDMRLHWDQQGKLCFTAHVPNDARGFTHCSGCFEKINKGDLSLMFSEEDELVYSLDMWPQIFPAKSEKNILKIEGMDSTFAYTTNPMMWCKWDFEGKKITIGDFGLEPEMQRLISCDTRFSAGFVRLPDKKLLAILHSHISEKDQEREYIYRFALFSECDGAEGNPKKNLKLEKISNWFKIFCDGKVFISSIEIYSEEQLIIGYGVSDSMCMFGLIDISDVYNMLSAKVDIPIIKIIEPFYA